ncbi:hypothetical protein CANINC_002843 [Pichia inconspicua]|uniref:BHLH domain-containing protein n=1 Tax=Pichia inconspicua TaxID=52247 RepID=A0A4T0X0H5_9ASCO|nr:hypothetical protein CANINC_002843 [[Candida] inconspicua]
MSLSNTPRIRSSLSKQTTLSPHGNSQSDGDGNGNRSGSAFGDEPAASDNDNEDNETSLSRVVSANDGGSIERKTSAVREPDRKRKDNINQKIQELHDLIPREFFADLGEKNTGTKDGKPNKGQILSKSVDYILWLQNEVDVRNRREVELALVLKSVGGRVRDNNTVAETMLAKIGVGPLAEGEH